MPWSLTLECPDCAHQWGVLKMRREEKNPPCPVCAAKPVETLAAPALNRGAAPETRETIPSSPTKRIDYAMRVASENQGGVDMSSKSRVGEAVALPVRTAPGQEARWGGGGPAAPQGISFSTAEMMASADRHQGKHGDLMDAKSDLRRSNMKPVYRPPKRA